MRSEQTERTGSRTNLVSTAQVNDSHLPGQERNRHVGREKTYINSSV